MGKAILSYTLDKKSNSDADELILLTGSLRRIDNCTRFYDSIEAMRQSPEFQERINNFIKRNENYIKTYNNNFEGEFTVAFIVDSDKREYLPILIDDKKPIRTRTSSLEEVKSEVEKARKLLFRSKNKLFLKRMIQDERFADTTDFDIKLKLPEYKEVTKKGIKPRLIDGEYYLTIQEILEYTLNNDKIGVMRGLVEDALEVWKENILALDDELLYYYSRHLRLALNAYDKEKIEKKLVSNLRANVQNMVEVVKDGCGRVIHYPVSGKFQVGKGNKTKRIEDCFT